MGGGGFIIHFPLRAPDSPIHLSRPCDHVLHVVGVTRAVHVSVVAVRRLILHVRGVDRDLTSPGQRVESKLQ